MAKLQGVSPEVKAKQELANSSKIPVGLLSDEFVNRYKAQISNFYAAPPVPTVQASGPPPFGGKPFPLYTKVKIINNRSSHRFPIGYIGTITSGNLGTDDIPHQRVDDGGANQVFVCDMELVQNIAAPPAPQAPQSKKTVPFESVVISQEKREEIKAAISQIENTNLLFDEWGFSEVFEKGTAVTLLFWGIPGGGKTLMAQAIAEEIGAEIKTYGMAEIGSSEPGGSERTIQKIFKTAKEFFTQKKQHQVILFDECDALLYDRNKVGVILGAQINTLLTEIERHDGIVIFTTNRIGVLDPALERRIAAKIEFPFPTREQREQIWKRMIPKKAPIAKDVNFKELSTYPLPGGNIKNAVLNAARMATYKKQKHITMRNFVQAIEKEAQAQAEFEASADTNEKRGWSTKPISDYGIGESRKLQIDSVFKQKERQS